ncbi:MAG: ribonuclease T2 [Xanthomonadales bacterium]|nr:ribonuclease T2 [Xanthomonadales bacterium]
MRPANKALMLLALVVLGVLFANWHRGSPQPHKRSPASMSIEAGTPAFDYYLIALSWSPSWCESHPEDREQCGRRGYGFILHGLWPQYETGGSPRDCDSGGEPDQATLKRTLAFMPSRDLIGHEWRTHGSCSGLDARAYFDLADRAYATVRIPEAMAAGSRPPAMTAEDVRSLFLRANPRLREDMLVVTCSAARLAEVRICVDTNLEPRTCGRGNRMQCPRSTPLRIPWSR